MRTALLLASVLGLACAHGPAPREWRQLGSSPAVCRYEPLGDHTRIECCQAGKCDAMAVGDFVRRDAHVVLQPLSARGTTAQ